MKKIIILSLIYFCLSLQSHANDLVGGLISEGRWEETLEFVTQGPTANNPDNVYTFIENRAAFLYALCKMPNDCVRICLTKKNKAKISFIETIGLYYPKLAQQLSRQYLNDNSISVWGKLYLLRRKIKEDRKFPMPPLYQQIDTQSNSASEELPPLE